MKINQRITPKESINPQKCTIRSTHQIQKYSLKSYRTHSNKLSAVIYKICKVVSDPLRSAIHHSLVYSRKGIGHGSEWGPGGESKKFTILKAAGYSAITLLTLPLVILGAAGLQLFHPGRGKDNLMFMDATKSKELKDYKPPQVEAIQMATFNIAALPSPIDAVKDVISSKKRAKEIVTWINGQEEQDLPLFIGLQEAFEQDASEIITNGTRTKYPFAVTNTGWAEIPFAGSNSGLQLHSRVPIKSAAFFPFQDLDGFGVRASGRGVLRVELDLGNGKSLMAYVTHTQPHSDEKSMAIRKNEIEAILSLMRKDRKNDLEAGIDREGEYYLLGDLNVGNFDDETLKTTNEHDQLREKGQVLHSENFYDAYHEDHNEKGERIKGAPLFLEKDTNNEERKRQGLDAIQEGNGTFYSGADQKDRGEKGYGTSDFYKGPQKTVDNCRYDYILRLAEDVKTTKGHVEARNILSKKLKRSPVSDHKMLWGRFTRDSNS